MRRGVTAPESFEPIVAPEAERKEKKPPKSVLTETARESLRLFRQGFSISEVATQRGFVETTILSHLALAQQKQITHHGLLVGDRESHLNRN